MMALMNCYPISQYKPKVAYLVSGVGASNVSALNALDAALIDAGIGDQNLIKLSSILPESVELVIKEKPKFSSNGLFVPVAYASQTLDIGQENSHLAPIASAVAVAMPQFRSDCGVIMERSDTRFCYNTESRVVEMAKEAFKVRNRELMRVESISAQIEICGAYRYYATFAGVVLWL